MEGLEAHHRAGDPLYKTMILLKDIVQIFDLPDLDCVATAGAIVKSGVQGFFMRRLDLGLMA